MVCKDHFTEAQVVHSPDYIWCILGSITAINHHWMFHARTSPMNKEKERVFRKESILKELLISEWDTKQRLVPKE